MTATYDLTADAQRDGIINQALRRLRVPASGQTGTANQLSDAAHALNLIVKQCDADPKIKMFTSAAPVSVSVSANVTSATLAANYLTVEGAYYKQTSDSAVYPLKPMTLQEYIESMNTDSTADTPEYYYVGEEGDRVSQIVMYLYPKVAAAGTVYYWARKKALIFDSASTQSDFADSWARWLALQLTADLAWEFGKPMEEIKLHEGIADKAYQMLIEQQVQNTDFHKTDQPDDNRDRQV